MFIHHYFLTYIITRDNKLFIFIFIPIKNVKKVYICFNILNVYYYGITFVYFFFYIYFTLLVCILYYNYTSVCL